MMLNWDLALIGSISLGHADPRMADKKIARPPEQGAVVAMSAKPIHRIVATVRNADRIVNQPAQ